MTDEKNYPTHRISFSELTTDERGKESLGRPVEVAAVFSREGKEGGIIQWNIKPEKLGEGVYFQLENNREMNRDANQEEKRDGFDQADEQAESPSAEVAR